MIPSPIPSRPLIRPMTKSDGYSLDLAVRIGKRIAMSICYLTDRTQESYSSIVGTHLIPALDMIPLTDLRAQHVQSYYAEKLSEGRSDGKGGLSARSVVYHHRILSKALDYAVKMGLVVRNVASVVEPPRVARVTMKTLSPEEVQKFLDAARETDYYVYFATLLYTGLRRGELLALRWRNLDLSKGTLTVVATAYKLSNGDYIIKEPKTAQSRRTVTMPRLRWLNYSKHTGLTRNC